MRNKIRKLSLPMQWLSNNGPMLSFLLTVLFSALFAKHSSTLLWSCKPNFIVFHFFLYLMILHFIQYRVTFVTIISPFLYYGKVKHNSGFAWTNLVVGDQQSKHGDGIDWDNGRCPLQWRHNDHDGVSNHQPYGCLLNRLFGRRSKKTSKLRGTGLCAQRASNAENVSIWWRHHGLSDLMYCPQVITYN